MCRAAGNAILGTTALERPHPAMPRQLTHHQSAADLQQARRCLMDAGDVPLGLVDDTLRQSWLRSRHAGLSPVDVLLVPHHGSKTSSTQAFLEALRPRWGLLQAGYRNRYGHPAAPVVARYEAVGTHLVLSPRCGAARWHSAEPQNVACMREDERHYWAHDVP